MRGIIKKNMTKKPKSTRLSMNLQDLTLLTQKPVSKTKFKGYTNIIYNCMKYLGEKHKDIACIIKNQSKIKSALIMKKDFAFVWNNETQKLFVPNGCKYSWRKR